MFTEPHHSFTPIDGYQVGRNSDPDCGCQGAYEGERYRDAIDSDNISVVKKTLSDDLEGPFLFALIYIFEGKIQYRSRDLGYVLCGGQLFSMVSSLEIR